MRSIERRKVEHLLLSLRLAEEEPGDTLLGDVHLVHRAAPELDLEDVDTSTEFLGHEFEAPIMVEGMTGGFDLAKDVNAAIASAVEELGLGMGVGSQRAALEDPELADTFRVVREAAPTAFVVGNIGAAQLLEYDVEALERAVEMVSADAMAIHFNPLQECVQPEGEPRFRGVIERLREVCSALSKPVIAKETGCGFSREDAALLVSAGVSAIDVSGLGGTSFAAIEGLRAKMMGDRTLYEVSRTFVSWGLPTAVSILEVRSASPDVPLIASGGIRSGLDVAKAIALGADMAGIGLPVLRCAIEGGAEAVKRYLDRVVRELRVAMFLVGASSVDELKKKPVVLSGALLQWAQQRGLLSALSRH